MRRSAFQAACWNGVPAGARGMSKVRSSPAKYASSCSPSRRNDRSSRRQPSPTRHAEPSTGCMKSRVSRSPSLVTSSSPIGEGSRAYRVPAIERVYRRSRRRWQDAPMTREAIGGRHAAARLVAPLPGDRLGRRFVQLLLGLVLYGVSASMLVLANLGLDPWDVLHQGLGRTFGVRIGTVTIVVSGLVLLLWIPLRQRPGVGTLLNAVLVGLVMNVVLARFSPPEG